jgi:hypothetical protein
MMNKPILTKIWRNTVRGYRFLRRIFPITWTGMALLVLAGLTIWTQGIHHKDLVLFTGALVVLAVGALLLVLTVGTAIIAAVRSKRAHGTLASLQLDTNTECSTGFAVRFSRWLPFVSLNWEWVTPAGVEVRQRRRGKLLEEDVVPDCRGRSREIVRKFTIRDFLGLSAIQWMAKDPVMVRILPVRIMDTGLALPLGLGMGEDLSDPSGTPIGDQVEMREYQPGDSPRLIRWKLYARTKKLLIRTPERAIAEQPSTCAYLLGGKFARSASELARELLERGSFGGEFLFGAEGSARVSHGNLELARDIVAESGMEKTISCAALPSFLRSAADQGFSDCLLFAPPEIAEIADGLAQVLSGSPLYVRAVVCVPELADDKPVPIWKRVVFRGDERLGLLSLRTRFTRLSGLCAPQIFEQRSGGFFAL